jgi:hypothetical protein
LGDQKVRRPPTEVYVNWIRRLILYRGKRHPGEMGKDEVTACLGHPVIGGHRPLLRR